MFEFDNKVYKKLALHGGGCPMFGHYIGLFDKTGMFDDFKSFDTPLITSSAGSMCVMYFILKYLERGNQTSMHNKMYYVYEKILGEVGNILDNLDQKSVITFEFIENLFKSHFSILYNLTFQDLNKIIPHLDWTVCCSKCDDHTHSCPFTVHTFGTHTPNVPIWKACIASMSVPILFAPVEINGNLFCDGEFSDWVSALHLIEDSECLHILCKRFQCFDTAFTDISLLDESIRFIINSIQTMTQKSKPAHGWYRTEYSSSIDKFFLSTEYIKSGQIMADKFVLK